MKVKIKNMTSNRGTTVPNQFIIITDEGEYFQSYDSVIAFVPKDRSQKTKLDETFWDYSRTTGIYRNQFLGEDVKETRKKIKDNEYELVNLN